MRRVHPTGHTVQIPQSIGGPQIPATVFQPAFRRKHGPKGPSPRTHRGDSQTPPAPAHVRGKQAVERVHGAQEFRSKPINI